MINQKLNDFKQKLRIELKGLICGLNSYDFSYHSDIKLFLKESNKDKVLSYLKNIGMIDIRERTGNGLKLKHNADLILTFKY